MITAAEATSELLGTIEAQILTRTHGRVRGLRVELTDDALVLRGVVPTHYTKQLALHGVLDVSPTLPVVNKIIVA
jgi:hypothetical protein